MVITSEGVPSRIKFLESEYVPLASAAVSGGGTSSKINMTVDASKTYQSIHGFGGAFTDAVAYNYESLSQASRQNFIEQHFGEAGIGYTVGRVHMGGCDFSRMDYTLAEVPGDLALDSFCLRDDTATDAPCGSDYKTPVIKAAQSAIQSAGSDELKLFASVWSAPTWYKDQKFKCEIKHAMATCIPAPELVADSVMCNKTVRDPTTCVGNAQGVPCPAAALSEVSAAKAPDPEVVARFLQARASDDASSVAQLETAEIERTLSSKSPSPSDPMTNPDGNCFNSGFLSSDDELQESWALYFSKFISAYEVLGIKMWGITVQNEPLATTDLWQSMFYTAETQANFLVKHLGPKIRANHPDVKIMIHDDQTISLIEFAGAILNHSDALQYIDGVGYHWYMALESTFQNVPAQPPVPIALVQNQVGGGAYVKDIWEQLQTHGEDKFVMATEACNGYALGTSWVGPRPGEWGYGYAYSHDVMWQLRNGASGWTDWNLLLDQQGGPNLAGNFVDAPVWVKDQDTLIQNPSFFHLAHFSKYVVPGSKHVELDISCGASHSAFCQAVAFVTPQGNAVVVITNDAVTVGPIAGIGDICYLGKCINLDIILPADAKGEGVALPWTISCGGSVVSGEIPWKGIQTVVMPCTSVV